MLGDRAHDHPAGRHRHRRRRADWVEDTAAEHGALHLLVTNAGGPPAGATTAFDLDDYRAAFELSMLAPHRAGPGHDAAPESAGWGRILMITSETVRQPIPAYALSNIVRPGLVGYAKTLVRELGPGDITVNVLAPGYTATAALPGPGRGGRRRGGHPARPGRPAGARSPPPRPSCSASAPGSSPARSRWSTAARALGV